MKFSESWLREWVQPTLSTQQLGNRLTMGGLELASITPAAPAFSSIVVAEVRQIGPHPDAERLRICHVECGEQELLQIICGANNVVEGMRAPLARVGAVLPDGNEVKQTKLRGVESFGMLCSSMELGLTDTASGLMKLPDDAPVGRSIRDYLLLDDPVLELDLTPNRADCLSIVGIAREVSVLTGAELKLQPLAHVDASINTTFDVNIESPQACPRYAGRVIKGIDPTAETPIWMQERLRRSGIRSIAPVVDVTNYVMLELGQPMHAFDLQTLIGGIRVRFAHEGEPLELLDGQQITADSETLVIADQERALALAGIMGGMASAVGEHTRELFLESAFFSPKAILGKARRYGLHTDSSHRFERGVDPALQVKAMERATVLLLDIVGGKPGPITDLRDENYLPKRTAIRLRHSRIERVLGVAPDAHTVEHMLQALGCDVTAREDEWELRPPSFRFDLGLEADLIEEVGRIYGYGRIPTSVQAYKPVVRRQTEARVPVKRLRDLMVDRGYQEAVTFSFVDPKWERLINPDHSPMRLSNPLSSDMSVMRGSLWPGLIKAVSYNLNRQQAQIKLFETGLRFLVGETGLNQTPALAGVITGTAQSEQWGVTSVDVDYFDVKGDVEALLELAGFSHLIEFKAAVHPALHPGQSAEVYNKDEKLGHIGALHPEIQNELDLEQRLYLFELDLKRLTRRRLPKFKEISRYPAIRRDVAIVVDETVTAAEVQRCIAAERVPQIQTIHLFDVYRGKGVTTGRKSLALGLILQDLSRTLNDTEVEEIVFRIVARLQRELGASPRE